MLRVLLPRGKEKYLEEGPYAPKRTSCPGDKEMYAEQWYTTNHIAAKFTDDENRGISDVNITWKLDEGQGEANLYKDLTGMGTTLTSANPGFGLALGGLLCKP